MPDVDLRCPSDMPDPGEPRVRRSSAYHPPRAQSRHGTYRHTHSVAVSSVKSHQYFTIRQRVAPQALAMDQGAHVYGDVVLLADGTEIDPHPLEDQIKAAFPGITHAFMIGNGHTLPGLLVIMSYGRPVRTDDEVSAFIDKLWPYVEHANLRAAPRERIDKQLILPIGCLQYALRSQSYDLGRTSILQLYAQEISRLYRNSELEPTRAQAVPVLNIDQMEHLVRAKFAEVCPKLHMDDQYDGQHVFGPLLDNLHALRLTRKLRQALKMPVVTVQTIHTHPSVSQLAQTLHSYQSRCAEIQRSTQQHHAQQVESVLDEYTASIDQLDFRTSAESFKTSGEAIIVVGSAGPLHYSQFYGLWRLTGRAIYHLASHDAIPIQNDRMTTLGERYQLIEWVPIDSLPSAIVNATLFVSRQQGAPPPQGASFRDWKDEKSTTWSVLVRILQRIARVSAKKQLEIISLDQWLEKFQSDVDHERDKELVDFLIADLTDCEAVARMVRDQLVPLEASSWTTIAEKEKWVRKWMAEWLHA
ncbi:hypothetical protein ANO11243_056690 [Dothideomycetidae sp. 11243]|nr:hypothetical protein ANO11243_056690 [fungal sp. No.11243]